MAKVYSSYYSSMLDSDLLPTEDQGPSHLSPCSRNDLISLLSLVTELGIDILQMVWEETSPILGHGGTAVVSQAAMTREEGMAFKRVGLREDELAATGLPDSDEARLYRTVIAEISLLAHPPIRDHPNFIDVEAICWDINDVYKEPRLLPVIIFEKATYGDLKDYMNSQEQFDIEGAIELFCTITKAVDFLHACRRSPLSTNCLPLSPKRLDADQP
jgi:hypothetical protein